MIKIEETSEEFWLSSAYDHIDRWQEAPDTSVTLITSATLALGFLAVVVCYALATVLAA